MKTDVTKQKYLRPAIAVFDMMEDKFLLATSPNVRPGGGGKSPRKYFHRTA